MNKRMIMMALAPFVVCTIEAQSLKVVEDVIDCGQIVFKKPVITDFKIVNTSKNVIKISEVRTSCGCTTVNYPKEGVAPGDTALVATTYDAKQMGHFEKQIAVYTTSEKKPVVFTLRGVVVDKIVNFTGEYPYTLGLLRADANNLEFDDVNRGEQPYKRIHIFNRTGKAVQPVVMHLPPYLTARVSPSTIASGHAGEAIITLNSKKLRYLGLTQTSVYLGGFPSDKVSPDKEISVSVVLLPEFKELAEGAIGNLPKLELSTDSLALGAFKGRKKLRGVIYMQNTGKTRLDIRSLQMFTTGIEVALNKTKLGPGESAKLKVTAYASELRNVRTQPRILMITNDPKHAKVVIKIGVQ